MTDVATTYSPKSETGSVTSPASSANAAEAPALITEQQVLFSTTAAVALPPAKTRRFSDAVHAFAGALRAVFVGSEKPPAQRHYPKRHVWLENSLMSREMDRL
jgi:hypothetical protein